MPGGEGKIGIRSAEGRELARHGDQNSPRASDSGRDKRENYSDGGSTDRIHYSTTVIALVHYNASLMYTLSKHD